MPNESVQPGINKDYLLTVQIVEVIKPPQVFGIPIIVIFTHAFKFQV